MCKSKLAFTSLCFFLVFVWGNQKANTTNVQTKINDSEILQRTNKRMNEWKLGHTQLFILFAVVGEKHCDEDVCLSSPFRYNSTYLLLSCSSQRHHIKLCMIITNLFLFFISFIGVVVIDNLYISFNAMYALTWIYLSPVYAILLLFPRMVKVILLFCFICW